MTDKSLFPLTWQVIELEWKLSVGYDYANSIFTLFINGVPYLELPYQAEVAPTGPQNIERGTIALNDKVIHRGFI